MITFNGVSIDTFSDVLTVTDIDRPLSAGARSRTTSIIGRDGLLFYSKDRSELSVSFEVVTKSDSIAERRDTIRELAKWLDTRHPQELYFDDEDDLVYYAVLDRPVIVREFVKSGRATISMLVPAGCAFARTPTEINEEGGNVVFDNGGSIEAPVLITAVIQDSIEEVAFSLTETEFITIERSLSVNEVIVIDTALRTVTVDDVDARDDVVIGSTFFKIDPGAGSITPDPSATHVNLQFRERYI